MKRFVATSILRINLIADYTMPVTNQTISEDVLSEANFDTASFRGIEAESSRSIFELAEGFRLKGNKFLAAKLLLTASTYDEPDSPYEQHYEACTAPQQGVAEQLDEKDKYDFLCVPSGNTGSSIVSHAMTWHPQISALSKSEVDQAIHSDSISELASRTAPFRQISDRYRHGIIQHNYIVGNHRLLDREQWPLKLHQLREVVKGDTVFQIVRDPLDSARSRFRRQTMAAISQQWRESTGQLKFVAPVKLTRVPRRPMRFKLENCRSSYDSYRMKGSFYTKDAMGLIDQLQIGTEYQKAFPDWQVLDMSDFSRKNVQNTLSDMYGKVGADTHFNLPLLQTPQNTNINRIMYSSWVQINHQGHVLTLGLYFADLATLSMDFPFIELAWRDPCEDWLQAGFPDYRLALTSNYQFWANLPLEMRQSLVKSGQLQKVLDNLVYPAILEMAKKTEELSRDIYEYIDNEQLDWVAGEVMAPQRSSIDQLISEHPHLAAKWHRYSEKFSQG